MINIVVPMAGMGSRFVKAGYDKPKPFIDVLGKPMIAHVIENLSCDGARFILIAQNRHLEQFGDLKKDFERRYNATFIGIDGVTEGAACTVLHARSFINSDDPLLIANSDQYVDGGIRAFVDDCRERRLDGSILTFTDPHRDPKWSFAKTDASGILLEVQEKKPISDKATVGIYLFQKGRWFVDAALDMIVRNQRVNNEFYVCPVYNGLVAGGKRVGIFDIDYAKMHGLGTPEDLNHFVEIRRK